MLNDHQFSVTLSPCQAGELASQREGTPGRLAAKQDPCSRLPFTWTAPSEHVHPQPLSVTVASVTSAEPTGREYGVRPERQKAAFLIQARLPTPWSWAPCVFLCEVRELKLHDLPNPSENLSFQRQDSGQIGTQIGAFWRGEGEFLVTRETSQSTYSF